MASKQRLMSSTGGVTSLYYDCFEHTGNMVSRLSIPISNVFFATLPSLIYDDGMRNFTFL